MIATVGGTTTIQWQLVPSSPLLLVSGFIPPDRRGFSILLNFRLVLLLRRPHIKTKQAKQNLLLVADSATQPVVLLQYHDSQLQQLQWYSTARHLIAIAS